LIDFLIREKSIYGYDRKEKNAKIVTIEYIVFMDIRIANPTLL